MGTRLRFVDLFAGLGGFHHGLLKAGGFECVFASEIDPVLRNLYETNFQFRTEGDITKVEENSVPEHDILCAGFPCQPFSLAGRKQGIRCPTSGRLIEHVVRIVRHRTPEFLILENVPGLMKVANGSTWKKMIASFRQLGYRLSHKIISPVDLGIPQGRRRLFMVASLNHDLSRVFDWSVPDRMMPLEEFLDNSAESCRAVEPHKLSQLHKWQFMLTNCSLPEEMPALSICAPEFGATYPADFSRCRLSDMHHYHGAYGQSLEDCNDWKSVLRKLPSYCRRERRVPDWLGQSIRFSRDIYSRNKALLDSWHADLDKNHNSWQVLEWRGCRRNRLLDNHLLQFRASGIRILKPYILPTLVAMTKTQVPIVGLEMRYLSKAEAAGFQNLHDLPGLPENDSAAFKAIGNAVNAGIVEHIALNIRSIRSAERGFGKAQS